MAAELSRHKPEANRRRAPPVQAGGWAIGVGVIVIRGGQLLFGLRRSPHGADTWSFPGGHLEFDETVEACALRELAEEAGVEAANPRVVAETTDLFPTGLRYRTLFVQAAWTAGEPVVREPEACQRWGWFSWDDAPEPLFLPVANLRATGFHPPSTIRSRRSR